MAEARLRLRGRQTQAALDILAEPRQPPLPETALPLEAYAALLRARHSDPDSASAWLAARLPPAALQVTPASESFLLDVARLMASLHRPADALALLRNILRFAEHGGRTHSLIRARAALAGSLIDSLDDQVDDDAEVAWEAEIARRIRELDEGKVKLVPWAEARRRLTGQ